MRVAHYVYKYWFYSGATQQAIKLANIMDKSGTVTSTFVNFDKNDLFFYKVKSDNGFSIIDIPSSFFFKVPSLLFLIVFSKYKFDLHHFHGFHTIAGIFVGLLGRKSLLKCTLDGSDDIESLFSRRFTFIYKWIVSRVSLINSLNNNINEKNLKYVSANKLTIIPNGVQLNKAFKKGERKAFLFAGAIVPRKRPLDVIKYYIDNYSNTGVSLLLAGPFDENLPEFDSEYFLKCEQMSKSTPGAKVEFIGHQTREKMIELYLSSIGLIFLSDREGTPNVVLEAMSCNCPVIHYDNDAVIKWLLGSELTAQSSIDQSSPDKIEINVLQEIIATEKLLVRAEVFSINKSAVLTERIYKRILEL